MGWFMSNRAYEVVRMNEAVLAGFAKVKSDVGNLSEWIKFLHEQNKYQQQLLQQVSTELATRRPPTAQELQPVIQPLIQNQVVQLQNEIKVNVRREVFNSQSVIKRAIEREMQPYVQHAVQNALHNSHTVVFERLKTIEAHITHLAQQPKHDPEIFERLRLMETRLEHPDEEVFNRLRAIETKIAEQPKEQSPVFDKLAQVLERMEQRVQQPIVQPSQIIYKEPDAVSNLQRKILQKVQRNSKEYVKTVLLNTITKYQQMNGLQLKEMIVDEQGIVSKSSLYRLLNELELEGRINVSQDGKEKVYSLSVDGKSSHVQNQNI